MYKPWYERLVELDSTHEREEFLAGVFGMDPAEKRKAKATFATLLIGGYMVNRALKGKKK